MIEPSHRRDAPIDLQSLQIFVSVADNASFSDAARLLGITQSAVSQTIRRLEATLGCSLLNRTTRPLSLTPAGDVLQQRARGLLTDAEHIRALVRHKGNSSVPIIRAGLVDSFAVTVGPDLVKGLREHAEQLRIWSGIAPNLGRDLLNRDLDLVISTDSMDELPGLEHTCLLREPLVLVVPKNMASTWGKMALHDLVCNVPLVRYSVRSSLGSQVDRHLQRLRLNVPPTIEFDATEAVFAMVAAGVGWAVTTPLCLLQGRSYCAELMVLPLPGPTVIRCLYLILRKGDLTLLSHRIRKIAQESLHRMFSNDLPAYAPWLPDLIRIGDDE